MVPFVLLHSCPSLSQIFVFIYLHVMISMFLSICVCCEASLDCDNLVCAHISAQYVIAGSTKESDAYLFKLMAKLLLNIGPTTIDV